MNYKNFKKKIQSIFFVFLILNFIAYLKTIVNYKFIIKKKLKKKIISKKKLINILLKKKNNKRSNICHIIGSGYSVKHSKKKINTKTDFVMGCNLAALIDLKFDLYSVEFGSIDKKYEPKYTVRNIVKYKLQEEHTFIIFKNITSNKLDFGFLSTYNNMVDYILDYSWRCFNITQLRYYIQNYLLKKNKKLFYQYNSTLVLLISIAYELNFKQIVIHGLDFGGRYFFSDKDIIHKNKHLIYKNELNNYKNNNISKKGSYQSHKTLNMKLMFKLISGSLLEKKITLYSATKNSASSKFLKLFNK
jgi:hypothetical protein